MADLGFSRRSVLAGSVALGALAVPTSLAAEAWQSDTGLMNCISLYRAAAAACDEYHKKVYEPACARWQAEKNAIPHYKTTSTWEAYNGRQLHMSTADEMACREAESWRRPGRKLQDDDYCRCVIELTGLIDRREAELVAASERTGIDAIVGRCDEYSDAMGAPLAAVEQYPVETVGDLRIKIEFLVEAHGDDLPTYMLLDDLNRICAKELAA